MQLTTLSINNDSVVNCPRMIYNLSMTNGSNLRFHKPARATLKDVANLAGVSEISVSRVMRDAPNISASLREKVMTAANALSYTPNRLAGALKSQTSNQVAVVLPSMSNIVFSSVLDGIESVLSKHGLHAVLGVSEYDSQRELEVVRELLAWSPMGIILTGLHQDPAVAGMIGQLDIPVVQIMDIDGSPIGSAVGISQNEAASAAADYLYAKGYRNIGYVGAWREKPDRSRARRLTFEKRLAALGSPLIGSYISDDRSSASVGSSATAKLIEMHPELDCIFYANDDLALGGLFYAMRSGIDVPTELGVMGFNGIDIGKATPLLLSGVETPRYEMGQEAARLLLSSKFEGPQVKDLSFKIIDGETT
ncbi:LacI family DNA-binding transcriptional regulator [Pelagimonas varians]|uniref:HTH-type transcriptional regulator GntR n=2 Tax=Pelagimonas varians TaxID=696760 RepID=A0A238L206_9RHOB|nr:LacI family DNA-binding transcriptional regulator [Pelagimonas varians]PYG26701.1 LacI family transcriptional regulator [Pelagimonas varians]SMX49115.1 HTH-type transcriptional regulator GntR [Pelagimonas varians]